MSVLSTTTHPARGSTAGFWLLVGFAVLGLALFGFQLWRTGQRRTPQLPRQLAQAALQDAMGHAQPADQAMAASARDAGRALPDEPAERCDPCGSPPITVRTGRKKRTAS